MKKIIQISVLFLAILIGLIWGIFRTQIYGYFKLPEPYVAKDRESPSKTEARKTGSPTKAEVVVTEPLQKTEATGTVPPQQPTVAGTMVPQKTALAKAGNEPAKMVTPIETPIPNSEETKKDQEERIQRIVMERYPDIPKIPFTEKYPDLRNLPRTLFPERVQTHQELNFKHTLDGKLVGVSVVKADGFVRPRRIDGDNIEVSSLANDQMIETLPLSETDFVAVIEADYEAGLERAIARLEEMREADRSEIRKNPTLYQKLVAEDKIWHDSSSEQFDEIKISVKRKLAGRPFKPVSFYGNGYVQVDDGDAYSGGYYVVIVLLEGTDAGFGPYHWRAKCLLNNGEIVGWIGIPEISSGPDS